jgi:hypothetical protein
MPLFTKNTPEPEVTGTDVVRSTLAAHAKGSLNLAVIARDLGVSAEALRGFLERRPLAPDMMQALVKRLFHGHAEFDLAADRLKPANREPARSVGVQPGQSPINFPQGMATREPGVFYYGPTGPAFGGAEPPAKAEPAWPSRPGWA